MRLQSKRRNYSRIRSGATPAAPTNIDGIEAAFSKESTMDLYGYTLGMPKTLFYRGTVRSAKFGFTVFASQRMVEEVKKCVVRHCFGDGTHAAVKKTVFTQLFVIHIEIANHVSNKDNYFLSNILLYFFIFRFTRSYTP